MSNTSGEKETEREDGIEIEKDREEKGTEIKIFNASLRLAIGL